jgi:hypothetical protein
VAVNRLWQSIFGIGLVKTSEDFGVQGEIPLHQDLLDWLAVDFRENKWDMKRLVRLIVTSDTYKQSSKVTAEHLASDPENRYFARLPRVRLSSLILRDIALETSGLLDRRIGGKPVYPYQPEGIWDALAITKERDFTYPRSSSADLYRRSLYTFWRRTVGPANMFDASTRQVCKVRSSSTNTPLHALTTLNDITWAEAARVLAVKVIESGADSDSRLSFAFRTVLSRPASPKEVALLKGIYDRQKSIFDKDLNAAKKLLSAGDSPVNAKHSPAELAAWTSLCLALYNLDEALTRE